MSRARSVDRTSELKLSPAICACTPAETPFWLKLSHVTRVSRACLGKTCCKIFSGSKVTILNRRVRTVWAGSLRREDPRIVGAAIESVGLVGAHMHSKADDSLVRPRG
jgi:hypothetical protein